MREIVLAQVKDFITTELLKRSINVNLQVDYIADKFLVKSTAFQTMPIIFKRLDIIDKISYKDFDGTDRNVYILHIAINSMDFNGENLLIDLFKVRIVINSEMSSIKFINTHF